jgi:hypothetical protein
MLRAISADLLSSLYILQNSEALLVSVTFPYCLRSRVA